MGSVFNPFKLLQTTVISSFHLIRDYHVLPDMGGAADAAAGMSVGLLKGLWALHSVSSSGFTKLAVEFYSSDCLYFVFLNFSIYRHCFVRRVDFSFLTTARQQE